jgi:hypothetical protein
VLKTESQKESDRQQHRHSIYASESTGLLLIALLVLLLTVIRYWHVIHWSWR